MTLEEFVDGVFDREGRRYADEHTRPRIDQPTAPGGITAHALAEDRGMRVDEVTREMLRALTLEECRAIVLRRVQRDLRDHGLAAIPYEPLRVQMLDFAHNSGTQLAIRWLQRTVGLREAQCDGVIGQRTLAALARYPPMLVNNALAASRARAAMRSPKIHDDFRRGVALRAIGFALSSVGDNAGEADIP